MNAFQKKALASKIFASDQLESIYEAAPHMNQQRLFQVLRQVCLSHDRLRCELEGLEILFDENYSKKDLKNGNDGV